MNAPCGIIIVGGVGSLEGAVLAAILYGFVNTFVTTIYDGTLANIVGLLLMLREWIAKRKERRVVSKQRAEADQPAE